MEISLLEMFLPKGLLDHFDAVKIEFTNSMNIYLDEKNIPPKELESVKLLSKGFVDAVTLQDFPIRDKACYLHLRRRKWLNETTGEVISNHWDLAGKGTRMTTELAAFLKEAPGYYIG